MLRTLPLYSAPRTETTSTDNHMPATRSRFSPRSINASCIRAVESQCCNRATNLGGVVAIVGGLALSGYAFSRGNVDDAKIGIVALLGVFAAACSFMGNYGGGMRHAPSESSTPINLVNITASQV